MKALSAPAGAGQEPVQAGCCGVVCVCMHKGAGAPRRPLACTPPSPATDTAAWIIQSRSSRALLVCLHGCCLLFRWRQLPAAAAFMRMGGCAAAWRISSRAGAAPGSVVMLGCA